MAKKKNTLNDLFDDPSPVVSPYADTNTSSKATESTHRTSGADTRTQVGVSESEASQANSEGHSGEGAGAGPDNVETGSTHNGTTLRMVPAPPQHNTNINPNANTTSAVSNTRHTPPPAHTYPDTPQPISTAPTQHPMAPTETATGIYGYPDSRLAKQQRNELRHRVRSAAGKYAAALQDAHIAQKMWEQICHDAIKAGCRPAMITAAAEDAELPDSEIPGSIRR